MKIKNHNKRYQHKKIYKKLFQKNREYMSFLR